jgi:hypothetical protein
MHVLISPISAWFFLASVDTNNVRGVPDEQTHNASALMWSLIPERVQARSSNASAVRGAAYLLRVSRRWDFIGNLDEAHRENR